MATEVKPAEHGCSFFTHTPESAFAPEDFSADELMMIQTAEQFCRKEVLPFTEQLDRQEPGLMPGLYKKAGQLGFCGVDMPEAYGGLGLGKRLSARILEFLSLNSSFSVTFGVSSGIGQFGVNAFGTDAQKATYLPHTCSGEWMSAYALSEPNSGTDALSASCRADFKNGSWVLNGTKMWISNAQWADLFTVFAKIDGEQFSAFLVERTFPGVSISREEHKMGLKGSSTARLILEDAIVPEGNLLHLAGKGHQVAFNCLNVGRFKLAAMSIGPARYAIELAAAYVHDRRQFGKPIAEFGLIRKKFAEMAARFFAAESAIYRTGGLIDAAFGACDRTPEGMRAAAEEYSVECSICKVLATETQAFVVDESLQCFGGYGYTEEFPIARVYRDSRVSRIYEGTNEINRVFIADRLSRRAAEGRASLIAAGDSFISDFAGKAMAKPPKDQIGQAALSDLLILAYAEQSARIRAKKLGGHAHALHRIFANWAAVEAARAYQTATGESVMVPAPNTLGFGDVAAAVLEKRGPL